MLQERIRIQLERMQEASNQLERSSILSDCFTMQCSLND